MTTEQQLKEMQDQLTELNEKREKLTARIEELAKKPGRVVADDFIRHDSEVYLRMTVRTIDRMINKLNRLIELTK